jgi:hypothetical protein
MNNSLEILKDIPEFKNHQNQLKKFQDRLEGMIRPYILQLFNKHEFNTHEIDSLLYYIDIFKKIKKEDQLLTYYYKCRRLSLEKVWNQFEQQLTNLSEEKKRFNENSFIRWLPTFFEEFNLLINTEIPWTSRVFPNQPMIIALLIIELMNYFNPDFKKRIENYIFKKENVRQLEDLILLYTISENFSKNIINSLQSLSITQDMLNKVMSSIYESYFSFQQDYPQLEKQELLIEIEKIKPVKKNFL